EASVIFSILFQFSMSFGIAISAMILRFSMQLAGETSPSQQDIHIAFVAIAVLVVMSLVDVWRLEKNAGEKVLAR
ncbi:MAG: MFS transporter, partial [Erwinia billingiae]